MIVLLSNKEEEKLESFEVETENLKLSMPVSEKLVKEENSLLKACQKKLHVPTFIEGQQKIEIGGERKSKLQVQVQSVEKKIKKFKWVETIEDVFKKNICSVNIYLHFYCYVFFLFISIDLFIFSSKQQNVFAFLLINVKYNYLKHVNILKNFKLLCSSHKMILTLDNSWNVF